MRKFLIAAAAATLSLSLVACGDTVTDETEAATQPESTAEPTPTPEPEPEPETDFDCDWLGEEAIALSERQAEDDPLSSQILALYNLEPVEDNIDAAMADEFDFDGNKGIVLACEGDANWTSGGDTGIRMEWTVDVNGDEFIGYEQKAASSDDPVTLPGVSTSVGQAYDNYGYTYVDVTVTNDGDSPVSAFITVRAENKKTVFDDGFMTVEDLKPGQSYTEDVQIGEGIPLNAKFTVIEVSEY